LPNIVTNNSCFIPEEKTYAAINTGDLHDCNDMLSSLQYKIPLPADGADRDVFVIFQAMPTPYAVVGGRVIDDGVYTGSDTDPQHGRSDVPLLEGGTLKERLLAAYKQKMSASSTYQGIFPIYVVRYRLKSKAAPGVRKLGVIARIESEPDYSVVTANVASGSLTSPVTLALWLLRAKYGGNFSSGIPLTSFYLDYE
jgi:hypothetical protein